VDWIHLAQDRNQWLPLLNTVMNLRVSWRAGSSWATVSFWRRILLHGAGGKVEFPFDRHGPKVNPPDVSKLYFPLIRYRIQSESVL
jgi:hypothetical protein